MNKMDSIVNSMTVDVEDYFQVSAFNKVIGYNEWDKYESRVEKNTYKILDIFDDRNIRATFFVLGWVAERHSNIVKEIYKRGHEVACHGYSHQLIYNQSRAEFKEETIRAKQILEEITGTAVTGYRAASYSITKNSLWALEILAESGFKYDSSIFPIVHDRYGIPTAPGEPHIIKMENGMSIIEFPLSTYKFLGLKLPVSGGGYFRLYPYQFTRFALKTINRTNKLFVFYLHPWEIDPQQPIIKASVLSRFRHYKNLAKCEHRLKQLLRDFEFTTMQNLLAEKFLNQPSYMKEISY